MKIGASKNKEPTSELQTAVHQNDASSSPMGIFFTPACLAKDSMNDISCQLLITL